ncbi:uncharacterized protein EV420DRAFT_1745372 [Desarmillaria tabescens]|uniref:Uncharacterized protein n=1 Tax=Armillaria tabescens TaxID=1929756 RepID=A0AA39TRD3_ARMTA|nr:uncharacterized protein EV420DRAFT_1745372 [Desarmillaria tabescens]KAK0463918.1 hypothetical protein EV420DRAFT_1745372 [Desarmillaria tabescens]
MYASHRDYDSPPPTSQFRRPWSPEPFDPNPRTDLYDSEVNYSRFPTYNLSTQRREPSVEALDLADYAATLRRQPDYDYNDDPHDYDYDSSIHRGVPSLVSRGETLSSNSHNNGSRFRAFSLPPPPPTQPRIADSDHDIDTSRFPAFTRHWYTAPPLNSLPFDEDPYTLPPKRISHTGTPFDPGHTYNSFPTHSIHHSTQYTGSNALPWSSDPDPPSYLDPSLKEERIRMLEREFATTPNTAQQGEEKPQIGMADGKGNLITQGPRKRTATRGFQVLLSLAAGIPGIYAAVAIKTKGTPPPAGTPAAYALYITSVVTFLLLFGLFIVRPCVKRPKKEQSAPGVNGVMVLPVGDNNKKKKKKKGKKGGPASQDVQVNLIVDPTMFRPPQEEASDSEDDATRWDGSTSSSRRKKNAKPARRSVFAGLHMEAEWRRARTWAKKVAVIDVFGLIIWSAVFVVVLLGKRCPSGDYEGWCNAYNVSSAAACLLCLAFGVSVFFDIKDLHASKVSPRTR